MTVVARLELVGRGFTSQRFGRAAIALLVAGGAQAQPEVAFIPYSAAYEYAANAYRAIWEEDGERIVAALESRTCLHFPESSVAATVEDAASHSGGPDRPMRLRASYILNTKKSTLVHELAHRHLWQLVERLDDIDGHMTLYLVLDRVWADVWGEDFANDRVQGESLWDADYAAAWAWARSLSSQERTLLWNRLLVMNGFPNNCSPNARSLVAPSSSSSRGLRDQIPDAWSPSVYFSPASTATPRKLRRVGSGHVANSLNVHGGL